MHPIGLLTFTLGTFPTDGLVSIEASKVVSIVKSEKATTVITTIHNTYESTSRYEGIVADYNALVERAQSRRCC